MRFLICFTGAASRQNVPKRPTPCPSRKSVNSQEDLIAKNIFFPRASRGVSFFFLVQPCPRSLQRPPVFVSSQNAFFLSASRGVFPNAGLSHHVSLLKTIFFSRASRGVCFFTRCKLPHEQNGSPRASPQTDLFYLVFPTKRIALPGLPREQILST